MRAIMETRVFLENFQNIELFYQGYYYIRVRLFHEIESANMRVFSTPLSLQLTKDL